MSRIGIKSLSRDKYQDDGPFSSYGTEIQIDGKGVKEVRSLDLRFAFDELVTARMEVIATELLDVEVDAHAVITVVAHDPSFAIQETPLPNGGRRIRVVPA